MDKDVQDLKKIREKLFSSGFKITDFYPIPTTPESQKWIDEILIPELIEKTCQR